MNVPFILIRFLKELGLLNKLEKESMDPAEIYEEAELERRQRAARMKKELRKLRELEAEE